MRKSLDIIKTYLSLDGVDIVITEGNEIGLAVLPSI